MPDPVEKDLWFEADQMDSVSLLAHFGIQDAHFCNDLAKQCEAISQMLSFRTDQ